MSGLPIRIISDMHLEFLKPNRITQFLQDHLPSLEQDAETVLIMAGDICDFHKPSSYLDVLEYTKRFRAVVFVAGNHEWYDGIFPHSADVFRQKTLDFSNFYFLDGTMVKIDDVNFIGATLWTDFNKNDFNAKQIAFSYMNDYEYIETEEEFLTPNIVYKQHTIDLEAIEQLLTITEGEKRVVVTHHGPSMKSVPERFRNSGLANYAFNSDLDAFIQSYQPELWVHGHTHTPVSYLVGTTQVICNPVGYQNYSRGLPENPDFNNQLLVHV